MNTQEIELKLTKKADAKEGYGAEAEFEFSGLRFQVRGGSYRSVSVQIEGIWWGCGREEIILTTGQFPNLLHERRPAPAVVIEVMRDYESICRRVDRMSSTEAKEIDRTPLHKGD